MTSIRLEGVDKSFPGVKALEAVSLTIEAGEFFTLLGPSGCGKTTLLRTIAGFYRQDKGHVYLGEELIDAIPPHQRETGMVFQNYAVFPHMTVFENVAFGLRNRRIGGAEIGERVDRALRMARLSGLEKRTPDQLSGGQQQRVGLARAMVIEPRVLLMDEPLSNLDAKLRIEMREEIRDIQRQLGITTLYVTHDQEEALVISDRIAVMKAGKIQQIGRPWEIYKNPGSTFVASFVGDGNFLEGEALEGGDGGLVTVKAGSTRIRVKRPAKVLKKLRLFFRPEELTVLSGQAREEEGCSLVGGKIRKVTFTGSLISLSVDCGGEAAIAVQRHRPEVSDILAPGTPVTVRIPLEAVLLFDPETGERL